MARSVRKSCDVCGNETANIVAKLHLIPVKSGETISHSDYTHHADVGECCKDKIFDVISFSKRRKRSKAAA